MPSARCWLAFSVRANPAHARLTLLPAYLAGGAVCMGMPRDAWLRSAMVRFLFCFLSCFQVETCVKMCWLESVFGSPCAKSVLRKQLAYALINRILASIF
ncbi:hypothetical protein Poly21_27500 [Allorhodopirellula heiligendammensis]|uniref:Uncharacterized protein n=1 Tax=Allorhodopirellula heiligendammensis TaxID=2714739 RepID=A0A5C6BTK7_9BACT|nr:hypothetical protein Poly21_27500 [Allorhodopirellula heiligendammensis]